MSLIREFAEEIRALGARKGYCRTSASKSEFALGYLDAFFEEHADEALRKKIRDRLDDIRETAL